MEAKDTVMSAEELDAFCEKAGLSNEDWDEGGGYVHEAVVRVIKEARQAGIKEVLEFLKKQGAVWVDKNYAIIEGIEKMASSGNGV